MQPGCGRPSCGFCVTEASLYYRCRYHGGFRARATSNQSVNLHRHDVRHGHGGARHYGIQRFAAAHRRQPRSATNSGTAANSGATTVTETLSTEPTAVSMLGKNWSWTQPSGPCTRSDLGISELRRDNSDSERMRHRALRRDELSDGVGGKLRQSKRHRRRLPVIVVLATLGVVLSAAVTAIGMHYTAHWQWLGALVFGSLIAATDPVSVIATFREANAQSRLRLLIEAESLFNDGTAAVAFGVVVALALGQRLASLGIAAVLLETVGGGVLCGAAVALGALLLAGRTDDHLVEITLTTVAAYGSFLIADHFGLSGVLATITAGLIMGNVKSFCSISERARQAVQASWEYAFAANSLIFLLIGMQARQNFGAIWIPAVLAIGLVTLGRAVAIYPCCLLFSRSSLRVRMKDQHILLWAGLRGAVALALALGLPLKFRTASIPLLSASRSPRFRCSFKASHNLVSTKMGAIPQGGSAPGDISCR